MGILVCHTGPSPTPLHQRVPLVSGFHLSVDRNSAGREREKYKVVEGREKGVEEGRERREGPGQIDR